MDTSHKRAPGQSISGDNRRARTYPPIPRIVAVFLSLTLAVGISAGSAVRATAQKTCTLTVEAETRTGDGPALVEEIEVSVENEKTGKQYSLHTNASGQVVIPEDPAANPLVVKSLRYLPSRTTYHFASGPTPANAQTSNVTLPIGARISGPTFKVSFDLFPLQITTKLEGTGAPVPAKVGFVMMDGTAQYGTFFISEVQNLTGTARAYLPRGPVQVSGATWSRMQIAASYLDPATNISYRGFLLSLDTYPPVTQVHEILLQTEDEWIAEYKKAVHDLLDLIAGADVANRVDAVQIRQANVTNPYFNNGIIQLQGTFQRDEKFCSESLFHEWTHAVIDLGFGRNEPGGYHPTEWAITNETLGWSEGRAHLFATLVTDYLTKPNTGSFNRANALSKPPMQNEPGAPGRLIEGVVATAVLEYYRQIYPGISSFDILKKFFQIEHGQQATTVNGYFGVARSLATTQEQDQIEQIQTLYRLVPLDPNYFTVGVARRGSPPITSGSITVSVGEAIDLDAAITTKKGFPVIEPLMERLELEWTEDSTGAGTGRSLYFKKDKPGTYTVRLSVAGKISEKREEFGAFSLTIVVTPAAVGPQQLAEAKYACLKEIPAYLDELIRLDEQSFTQLEHAVTAEIRKRIAEGRYPFGLTPAETRRMGELEQSIPPGATHWGRVRDPLTGEDSMGWIVGDTQLSAQDKENAKELRKLKAKVDPDFAQTYYELDCIGAVTGEHVQHRRDLKARLRAVEESNAFKLFREYANLNDWRGYLDAAAQIEAVHKLPCPLPRPPAPLWTYSAPCASPGGLPPGANFDVTLTASPKAVAPGATSNIVAKVTGGTVPFTYEWSGHSTGQDDKVAFTVIEPGDHQVSVTVTDGTGRTTSNVVTVTVQALEVSLEISPSGLKVPFGEARSLTAKVTSGGQPATGQYVYRWEPGDEATFTPPEGSENRTQIVFDRPGRVRLWVSVLTDRGARNYATLGQSQPLEIEVTLPNMSIVFDQAAPYVGQETKARVTVSGAVPPNKIDIRWLLPGNAELVTESLDRHEVTFRPKDWNPMSFTAIAQVPNEGSEIGRATATLAGRPYDVRATVVGPVGEVRPAGIAVNQNVVVRASIAPQPPRGPVRFLWFVTEDGASHFSGMNVGSEVSANRSEVGTCEVVVEARDSAGLLLGKSAATFQVTISQGDLDRANNAREAQAKLTAARDACKKGRVEEAIKLLEEASVLDPASKEIAGELSKTKKDFEQIQNNFRSAKEWMDKFDFPKAQSYVFAAKNVNPFYQPSLDLEKDLNQRWTAWRNRLNAAIDDVQHAIDTKDFAKALELAAAARRTLVFDSGASQTLGDKEQWAAKNEAEKQERRRHIKLGEEKYRAYDFEGAIVELRAVFMDATRLWQPGAPELVACEKLQADAVAKVKRITELMSIVGPIAEDPGRVVSREVLENAIKNADEVLALQPTNADARRYREILAARLRERSNESSAVTFIKQGDDFYEKSNYQQALDAFNKAVEADPNSAAAYAGRCLARRGLQDNAGALADCSHALQLDPNNAAAYRGRSMIKRGNNDYQGALTDANRAIELAPDNYRSYLTRGLAREALKDFPGAIGDFNRAIQINPSYAMSYFCRGRARLDTKDNAGALADYNHFIESNATDSMAFNNRGLAKERLGDTPGAIADYEKAISLNPNNNTAKKNLARVRTTATNATPATSSSYPQNSKSLNTGNTGGVHGGPTVPTTFRVSSAARLVKITNYHWNDGRGAKPGIIGIRLTSGGNVGSWPAAGSPGSGGAPNAYWTVEPGVELAPGTYTIVDSDPATWSCNAEAGGRGMSEITLVPLGNASADFAELLPTGTTQPTTNGNVGPVGSISGRATLVAVDSGRDYVGGWGVSFRPDGKPDARFKLYITAPNRTVTFLEVANVDGVLCIWNTAHSRWALGVVRNGQMVNRSDGTVAFTLGAQEEVIDLFVTDPYCIREGKTHFRLTIGFQNGEPRTASFPVR